MEEFGSPITEIPSILHRVNKAGVRFANPEKTILSEINTKSTQ